VFITSERDGMFWTLFRIESSLFS